MLPDVGRLLVTAKAFLPRSRALCRKATAADAKSFWAM